MLKTIKLQLGSWRNELALRCALLTALIVPIWLISVSDLLFGLHLSRYGIRPWHMADIAHILWAPWIHANFAHLAGNTFGLVTLGWLSLWPRTSDFVWTVGASILGAGLCAWLIGGSHSVHFGASGIVFGFAGFLLARCWYSFSLISLLTAGAVVSLYGVNLVIGVLPVQAGVSWQGHLGGALAGILVARLQANEIRAIQ